MTASFYEITWYFFLYACIGWCCEVGYKGVLQKTFINRGFLNGPVCPIYGVGVLSIILVLSPFKQNIVLLFVISMLFTTVLELVTGFLMERFFHAKWWDYTEEKYNFHGYICIKASLSWGVLCTLMMYFLQPLLEKFVNWFPKKPGNILLSIFAVLFLVDLVVTVIGILHIQKRIRMLEEIAGKMHIISDKMGTGIFESIMLTMEKGTALKESLTEKQNEWKIGFNDLTGRRAALKDNLTEKGTEWKENLSELLRLSEKYRTAIREKGFITKRIMRAFPDLSRSVFERYENKGKSGEEVGHENDI